MSWQNPPIPWSELERKLSGRPQPVDPSAGDGGDSPAWSRKREAYVPRPTTPAAAPTAPYAELHAHSSFSFLDGASSPEEMAEEAVDLGLEALALTDHDGLYGVVRFAEAADALGLPTIFGTELSLDVTIPATQAERMIAARVGDPDPPQRHLLVLARDPAGYASLARSISDAQLRGGPRAGRCTTRTSWPPPRTATGWCSPGAARGRSSPPWIPTAPAPSRSTRPGVSSTRWSAGSVPATS